MKERLERFVFEEILENVPPVPELVRYYDNFSDSYAELIQASTSEQWILSFDGRQATLDFRKFDVMIRTMVKSWCSTILAVHCPREVRPADVPNDLLELTAMLLCSYQFGFRAKQIAMLEMRNIRIWNDELSQYPAVHLTFVMIKQRSAGAVFPMVRRLKREWSPLFIELFRRVQVNGLAGPDHVFRRSPRDVSDAIGDITEIILGTRRGIRELRHSAAQRLADAGASEEELAAFMGHTDLDTSLIYFRSSASQGERVNQALAVSAVYQGVVEIAHNHFISMEELAALKGDQQIAGVPHGIPIAGIGGCTLGQPNCPYNPIMSCYGCPKFMPVADAHVHETVLADLRDVMKFFYASSRGERGSPAFQLEGTIATVQAVLSKLRTESNELLP